MNVFFLICSQNAYLTMARTFNRGKNPVKQNKTVEHFKKKCFSHHFLEDARLPPPYIHNTQVEK